MEQEHYCPFVPLQFHVTFLWHTGVLDRYLLRSVTSRLTLSDLQNPNAHPRPVAQDLAGFWDMLQLSIENISLKFDELHQLKANNWRPLEPPERKVQ